MDLQARVVVLFVTHATRAADLITGLASETLPATTMSANLSKAFAIPRQIMIGNRVVQLSFQPIHH